MFSKTTVLAAALLLLTAAAEGKKTTSLAWSPLTPAQQQVIVEAIAQEKVIVSQVRRTTPVVQSYIQTLRPGEADENVPISDQYMIGRVDFGKAFVDDQYSSRSQKHSRLRGSFRFMSALTSGFHLTNSPTGFMAMMFVDPTGFDQQHYGFRFVRREFLGTVRTNVFDVRPTVKGPGRFYGRIWIEDEQGNIVRFNGTYTNDPNDDVNHYFHFDSWRTNIQPGIWLPASIYVEDSFQTFTNHTRSLRGQTTYWGYSLKLPTRESDAESLEVEGAVDESDTSQDVSPLEARRLWVGQAEQNVLDRLVQAGLVAPPSDFDKVLDQVASNIVISNQLQLPNDIHCRVILTDPLEALAIGNTILISKGLIDVLPNEESLAAVISFELAHVLMGHRIDTRYAFNDRLLFPDAATFQRITMNHSTADDEEASKRAVELFRHSNYSDKAAGAGLFLRQVEAVQSGVSTLLEPRLGDSLLRADGQPWLAELAKTAPQLRPADLTQVAALPLNSRLKIDPWDDRVSIETIKPDPLLSASDKMPLEIAPVYYRLHRYQNPAQTATAAAAPATQLSSPDPRTNVEAPSVSHRDPR